MNQRLGGLLLWIALLFQPQSGHALSFTVNSITVNVSDTFSINLDVVNALDLTAWQFDLAYNPRLLQASRVFEGPFFATFGTTLFVPGFIDNTTGLISGVSNLFVDLAPNPQGNGVLATIEFRALASGTSRLDASNVFFNGLDSGFTMTNGSGCVRGEGACSGENPVPEPSSLSLVLSGGCLLWGLYRWRDHVTVNG